MNMVVRDLSVSFYFLSAVLFNFKGPQIIFSELSNQVASLCSLLRVIDMDGCLMLVLKW